MAFLTFKNIAHQLAMIILKVTFLFADTSYRSAYLMSEFFYFQINKLVLIIIAKYRNRLARQKAINDFAEKQKKRIQKSNFFHFFKNYSTV